MFVIYCCEDSDYFTCQRNYSIGVQFESISVAQHQLAKVNHRNGSIFVIKMVWNEKLWSTRVQHDIPHLSIKLVSFKKLIVISKSWTL